MALYAFDGTWNEDETDEGKDTNVVKFCTAYTDAKFYLEGIGTRLGFVGELLGGVAGAGGRIRIREAMEELTRNFVKGDRAVDIIGFSRGAALALHFANEIQEDKQGAEVRFLGLWDTVASFGIPGNALNFRWTLTLPGNVKQCYHAMALDERRDNFPLTRLQGPVGETAVIGRVREVWFRGMHSDVGGGKSVGLSSLALCWMLRRAQENGLPIDGEQLEKYGSLCNRDASISKNFDPKLDSLRRIAQGDAVHESVRPRRNVGGIEHNDPPSGLMIAHD